MSDQPAIVSPTPAPPAQAPAATSKRGIKGFFAAIWALFKTLALLPVRLLRGRAAYEDTITVYSAHPSFYLWLPIMTGFVGSWMVRWKPHTEQFFGWVYLWVIMFFIVTLLYDFSIKKLGLWLGIFTFVWLLSKYFEDLQNIVILSACFSYLRSLDPKLDPGMATVLSWLMLLPWIGSLVQMALNGRKTFSPNEIGEVFFGEGNELTDRTGLRFRTKYRDLLETMLTFGGGDLQAIDNHQNVIKHWDNIIGLFIVWKDLDRILHQRAVVDEKKVEPGNSPT